MIHLIHWLEVMFYWSVILLFLTSIFWGVTVGLSTSIAEWIEKEEE